MHPLMLIALCLLSWLATAEEEKKHEYSTAAYELCFVVSVNGVLGHEASMFLQCLAEDLWWLG